MADNETYTFWKIILLIGILSNIVGLVLLPDSFFNDTFFHIDRSLDYAQLNFSGEFSLYYLLSAPVYMVFPPVYPFTKIIPALLTLSLFWLAYRYFSLKLGLDGIIAMALFFNLAGFTRYSSINLIGQLGALFVLAALYFHEKSKTNRQYAAVLLAVSSRLTNLPILIGELLHHNLKYTLAAITGLLFIQWYWIFPNGFPFGLNIPNPVIFIATFLDFPPPSFFVFEQLPFLPLALVFIFLTSPILLAIIADFRRIERAHQYFLYLLFAVILVSLVDSRMAGNINWRHLTSVMPLLGLFFARGFMQLKPKKWVKASMAFYAVYSFLLILLSSLYYNGFFSM